MRRIASLIGLLAILVLAWDVEALSITQWRPKRSIDLNEVYEFNMRQRKLPSEVVPLSYHLELEPDIAAGTYVGRVKINVTWKEQTDQIVFNAEGLSSTKDIQVRLTELSPKEKELGLTLMDVNVASVQQPRSESRRWYTIQLEQMVPAKSKAEVEISFVGNLTTNETSGFFRSEYMDYSRKLHKFIATANLRLYNARNIFPCMDEPPYKANFKLSILRPKDMTTLSNMPVESSVEASDRPGMVWDHFMESPEMSTFQFALILSHLQSIRPSIEVNEIHGKRLEIAVWGREEYLLESLKDVPNKVVKIVNYLQEYFNSSIGLPKLDIVAVPMYNPPKPSDSWGLIFFKESELSSPLIWNTACEIIYQWIGQYITPSGWSAAPINKALNSFLASMATVDINPDEMEGKWPMTMLYSLYYEYGKAVPFSVAAGFRNEATSAKTELIFRMFNYTLGRDTFQKGVRNFVHLGSEDKLRTFLENDIYVRLNEVASEEGSLPAGLSINRIARSWIYRDRIPLVTAIRNYETKSIILTLDEYLREPAGTTSRSGRNQWDIPLVMISQGNLDFSNTKPTTWLTKDNCNIGTTETQGMHWIIDDPSSEEDFVIINPEEIGMFLVNYDTGNWKKLSTYLQGADREKIPALSRAKLLHDSWNLAYAGEQDFGIALNMTLFLKQERSHVVWQPVFTMIDHIGRRIEGSDVYPKFEAYIRTLLKPLYEELGETAQPGEPFWKVHIRGLAKNFLCRAGYQPCIEEARNQYKKWLTDEEPDKGNPVANEFICPVFKWGTEEEWEFGLQRVINFPRHSLERKQNERTYLLKTLASCPKDTYKIERLLNVTILNQNGNFTDSDIRLIFSMLTSGAAGYTTLFNFLANNWDTIKQRFENKNHLWNGIVNSATSSFNTEEGFEMVSELYTNHRGEFESAESIIQEALRVIKQETEWSKKNLPVIDAWLNVNLPRDELKSIKCSGNSTLIMAHYG